MPPSAPSKTQSAHPFDLKTGISSDLARPPSGPAVAAPVRAKFYTPKEFSAALADCGLRLCERAIAARCGLPIRHRDHIATNGLFKGRHFIPESELFRLVGITEAQQ